MVVASGDVPGGLTWKRGVGAPLNLGYTEYSMGKVYKRVHNGVTNETTYYRLIDDGARATPAEVIDAEPQKPQQVRYYIGSKCWFVDNTNHWFLCEVVGRRGRLGITIKSATGWDDKREVTWPYGGELEFTASPSNFLFQRLRPLKARQA